MANYAPNDAEAIVDRLAPAEARSALHIDLAALVANWRQLAMASAPAECAAVIKANAYGIGQGPAAQALYDAGCRSFFVASLEEAVAARASVPSAAIFVLDGLASNRLSVFAEYELIPVLSTPPQLAQWIEQAETHSNRLPAAIMVDTGMNRLGISAGELTTIDNVSRVPSRLPLTYVMSHLACADDPEDPKNFAQRTTFDQVRRLLPGAKASLANSAGIFLGQPYHYDLVRPGIAIYGGRANSQNPNPMRPVATVMARILQTRTVQRGETVGYGATWQATRTTRLATLACGYADGYFRCLSASTIRPAASVYIKGYYAPVIGRVSMDLMTIDISAIPEELVHPNVWAELMGTHVLLDDLADRAGTIGYEILTRIGHRFHRVYTGP